MQQLAGKSQNQVINFGTLGHIPSSAQKIAPSIQRIRGDIDPYVYNQRLQAASQQRTQQIEIPQGYGYHYGTDYNTLHMVPNLGYQGTRDFNPQMGQHIQRAIQQGRLKFDTPQKMKVDDNPFPGDENMVNAELFKGKTKVLTSTKSKEARTVDPKMQISADEYREIRKRRADQKSRYE